MARRQREAEIEAEKTYLQSRVREGRVRVMKVNGEFKVVDKKTGEPLPNQKQFAWLYYASSLAGLEVEERTTAPPPQTQEPAPARRVSLVPAKKPVDVRGRAAAETIVDARTP